MRREPLFPDIGKLATKKVLWVVLNGCEKSYHKEAQDGYAAENNIELED